MPRDQRVHSKYAAHFLSHLENLPDHKSLEQRIVKGSLVDHASKPAVIWVSGVLSLRNLHILFPKPLKKRLSPIPVSTPLPPFSTPPNAQRTRHSKENEKDESIHTHNT